MVLLMLAVLQLRELGNGVRVCIVLVQGPAPLLRSVLQRCDSVCGRGINQLASCKILERTNIKAARRATLIPPQTRQK